MQCDKRVYFCSFSLRFNEVPYIKTEHYPPGISTYHQADFNPRSRKESDDSGNNNGQDTRKFQSTLSQGERHERRIILCSVCRFQSTLSQGERRNNPAKISKRNGISIHALARRATRESDILKMIFDISIHALARRAT